MIIQRLLILLLSLTCISNVFSQGLVFGKVQDAFLKTPLPEAKVSLLLKSDSTIILDSIPIRKKHREDGTVKEAEFMFQPEKKTCEYLIRGTLNGYEDGYQLLVIEENERGVFMLDNPLELRRMRQVNLNEVTVTATRVKMYWKGDTLVYDATAFQLPDGSMLDDLIRQMPGVTMNEHGEMFVNGRKIDELQLGSRAFMRGNKKIMLENLPYYTVKDIKVYEQDTDLNRATGTKIEDKKYVMDVSLKPEYQQGYVANMEIAGGTQERWLERAFLLGFTRSTRYTFLSNSNNVNENRHIGSTNHWTPNDVPKSLLTVHSVAGEIDYQSVDKNVQETLNVDFTSTRNEGEMIKHGYLFLPSNPLQTTHQNSQTKEKRLKVGNHFRYIKPKSFMIDTDVALNYKFHKGNTLTLTEQYVDSLTMLQRTDAFNDGKTWNLNLYTLVQPTLNNIGKLNQYFRFTTRFDYTSDENQHAQRFFIEDFVNPSYKKSHNANDYSERNIAVYTNISYGMFHGNLWNGNLQVTPSYSRKKTHDWLYHPDTLMLPSQMDMLEAITDHTNSYSSDLQTYKSDITLDFALLQKLPPSKDEQIERNADFLHLCMRITPIHEKLHYIRGSLDTWSTRNTVSFEPRLDIHLFVKKDIFRPATISIGHYEYNTPLINQINFRDDATPLVVRLGNPNLKPWHSVSYIQAEYRYNRSNRHSFKLSARYGFCHNEVSQSVSFNPITSVYTYRPENTHGTYDIKTKASVFHTLDRDRRWTVENNFDGNFIHWVDHIMLAGETESRMSTVNALTLHNNTYIQYNKDMLNIRAIGDVKWRHSKGRMHDFNSLNVTDFQYGLSTSYTIPKMKTTISVEGSMYSRRGYDNATLNTDDLVLNASISQPLVKGKLIARIEAFDLLHQLSNTQYEVNAQGRIETWHRSLPNYVMLHLQWMFNKSPKNK